jgi:pSer/pThr/pTyr-binding forkhead associated (FHA) protein
VSVLAGTTYESVLLALKIAFLVLLYLFIWRIVRTAARDLRLPQESFILRPALAGGAIGQAIRPGRLVVTASVVLDEGDEFELDSSPLTIGRGGQNDVAIDGDEFASARHVRIEPRRDGVWVHDLGSTNGTYVNGVRLDRPRKLVDGDVVKVGETELRFEDS